MKNSFTGYVREFPNAGIHALCAELMTFRRQLTTRPERRSESGWNNALNGFLKNWLRDLAKTVKRATYSPLSGDPDSDKAARVKEAKDTGMSLDAAFDGKSINSDDIVMPAMAVSMEVAFDLTGAHANYPQPTVDEVPNEWLRNFITRLDRLFVMATNFDSRHQPGVINSYESAQALAVLNELFAICELKGGEANRRETPTGLMPSDRPGTFNADGAYNIPVSDSSEARP